MNTETRNEILHSLDDALEERGWDRPASFLVLSLAAGDEPDEVELQISELPMATEDPAGRLLRMAENVVATGADEFARLGGADAVVFVSEAWMLMAGPEDDIEEMQRAGEEHRVHQHPQRVEVRIVSLVSTDNDQISQLMRERESGKVRVDHEGAPGCPDLYAGRIPKALTMLAGHKPRRPSLN